MKHFLDNYPQVQMVVDNHSETFQDFLFCFFLFLRLNCLCIEFVGNNITSCLAGNWCVINKCVPKWDGIEIIDHQH